VSLRNRELANLIVVGALTAIGFASVYIARQAVVSTGALAYAGFFFALYLAAHLVCRLTVPNADPYLLPMAALLTAVGVTEIYRLDPTAPFRPGPWIGVSARACGSWSPSARSRARCSCCSGTTGGSRATSTSAGSERSRS